MASNDLPCAYMGHHLLEKVTRFKELENYLRNFKDDREAYYVKIVAELRAKGMDQIANRDGFTAMEQKVVDEYLSPQYAVMRARSSFQLEPTQAQLTQPATQAPGAAQAQAFRTNLQGQINALEENQSGASPALKTQHGRRFRLLRFDALDATTPSGGD